MDLVLTPAEVGKFQEALLSAFNRSELEQLVYLRLEVNLNDVVADGPHRQVVFDLIKWANGQGKIEALLRAAREENPGNVLLRQFDEAISVRPVPPQPIEAHGTKKKRDFHIEHVFTTLTPKDFAVLLESYDWMTIDQVILRRRNPPVVLPGERLVSYEIVPGLPELRGYPIGYILASANATSAHPFVWMGQEHLAAELITPPIGATVVQIYDDGASWADVASGCGLEPTEVGASEVETWEFLSGRIWRVIVDLLTLRGFLWTDATQTPTPKTRSRADTQIPRSQLRELVDLLQQVPGAADFAERTAFLAGIPGAQALTRSQSSLRADLDSMVNGLNELGRLASGEWPLLILIDNALGYVSGFELELQMQAVRRQLAQAYGEA